MATKEKTKKPSAFNVVSDIVNDLKLNSENMYNEAAEAIVRANPQAGLTSSEQYKDLVKAYAQKQGMLSNQLGNLFQPLMSAYMNTLSEDAAQNRFQQQFDHQVSNDQWQQGWQNKFNAYELMGIPITLQQKLYNLQNSQRWGDYAWDNRFNTNKPAASSYSTGKPGAAFYGQTPWNSSYLSTHGKNGVDRTGEYATGGGAPVGSNIVTDYGANNINLGNPGGYNLYNNATFVPFVNKA